MSLLSSPLNATKLLRWHFEYAHLGINPRIRDVATPGLKVLPGGTEQD